MTQSTDQTQETKWLWKGGALLLNVIAAIFGTAIIESPVAHFLHPHTIQTIMVEGYLLSLTVACLVGFFVYRRGGSDSAKWVGVIGVCWFAFRGLMVLAGGSSAIWSEMSGIGCVNGVRAVACMNWSVFTLPALRMVSYSLGAWLCFWTGARGDSALETALVGDMARGAQKS